MTLTVVGIHSELLWTIKSAIPVGVLVVIMTAVL